MYGPAVRQGSSYKYENSVVPGFPPWHPNPGKSALLCVTTSGILKLFFSQNNNKHEEAMVELENVNSSEDRITHASFSSDKSKSEHLPFLDVQAMLKVIRFPPYRTCHCVEAAQGRPSPDTVESTAGWR